MRFPLALLGALPAFLAMWYVDRIDRRRPFPPGALRKVAIAGALSTLPVIVIEILLGKISRPLLSGYGQLLFNAVVIAAATEELAKLACVRWLVWKKARFDERLDAIVFATRAGLGFALVENIFYLWSARSADNFLAMYLARAVLAVPSHAIYAGVMGYFIARRQFDRSGPGLLGGYLIAVALHGVYDSAVFITPQLDQDGYWLLARLLALLPVAVVAGGFWALRQMATRALVADDIAFEATEIIHFQNITYAPTRSP